MADPNAISGSFALDVNAISKLKYSASKHSGKALHKTAQQFEALFIKQMLSSMRKAIPKSHLLGDSSAHKQYQQMMDAQWSQVMAKRGIGLADTLTHQLAGHGSNTASQSANADGHTPASIAKAHPRPLAASDSLAAIKAQRAAAAPASTSHAAAAPLGDTGPLVADAPSNAPILSLSSADKTGPKTGQAADPVSAFVDRLGSAAEHAARRTGLSSRLILAQAALETGWGRHEITTDSGQPSHNVFNVKADGWHGASTDVTTHEYSDGTAQRTQAGFRVYDSYDQAFDDYARLIDQSPRYAAARQADSPAAAARALQNGGYATDPNYANKLVAIMDQIPASSHGGLFAGRSGAVVNLDANSGPVA